MGIIAGVAYGDLFAGGGFVNGAGCFVAAFPARIFAALVTVDALGRKDYTHGWYFIAICLAAGIVAARWI